MSQTEKAAYYAALKNAGVKFDKHYREYSTEELEAAWLALNEGRSKVPDTAEEAPRIQLPLPPQPERDEVAGLRVNSHSGDEPLRVEPSGRIVYQDEVKKSAFPKPRGRRVLEYVDPGVKKVEIRSGEYIESFEMPGDDTRRAQARITLPSYQTGIYKEPNMPFKIHEYNGARGFDLFDVQGFYGGADLVPADIKRTYVSNDLCYDIRTTIRAIEAEYRDRVLQKGSL